MSPPATHTWYVNTELSRMWSCPYRLLSLSKGVPPATHLLSTSLPEPLHPSLCQVLSVLSSKYILGLLAFLPLHCHHLGLKRYHLPTGPPHTPPPDPRAIHPAHRSALALCNDNQTVLSLLKWISFQLLLTQSLQHQQGPAPSTPGPCTPGARFYAVTQILPTCGSPHVHPPWTATLLSALSGSLSSSCIFGGDCDSLKRTVHDTNPLSWYSSYRPPTDVCNRGLFHAAAVSHPILGATSL